MRVSVDTVYNTALTDISKSLNAAGVVLCAYAGGSMALVTPLYAVYLYYLAFLAECLDQSTSLRLDFQQDSDLK